MAQPNGAQTSSSPMVTPRTALARKDAEVAALHNKVKALEAMLVAQVRAAAGSEPGTPVSVGSVASGPPSSTVYTAAAAPPTAHSVESNGGAHHSLNRIPSTLSSSMLPTPQSTPVASPASLCGPLHSRPAEGPPRHARRSEAGTTATGTAPGTLPAIRRPSGSDLSGAVPMRRRSRPGAGSSGSTTPVDDPDPIPHGTIAHTVAGEPVGGSWGGASGAGNGSNGHGGVGAGAGSGEGGGDGDGDGSGPESLRVERPATPEDTGTTAEHQFIIKVRRNLEGLQPGRKPAVLVCTGSFNPVHLQHARIFYIARQYLQQKLGYQVVGGLMAPNHDSAVRQERRMQPSQIMPAHLRVAMCELAVARSSWLAVDRWAVTRNLVMDYPSVLRNVQQLLRRSVPKDKEPQVMFLCGADQLVKSIGRMNFTCVCVARPGYMDELRRAVGKKHKYLVHVIDDDSVISSALDACSSTRIRKALIDRTPVVEFVGTAVDKFLAANHIADKMAGRDKWTAKDKRPVARFYTPGSKDGAASRGPRRSRASRGDAPTARSVGSGASRLSFGDDQRSGSLDRRRRRSRNSDASSGGSGSRARRRSAGRR